MGAENRKLAAIMFTDIAGYSALSQRDEATALRLLEDHQNLLRPLFDKFHGREIKTMGDAFLVEFPSAVEAAGCAVESQRAIHEYNALRPSGPRIEIRVGLHVGDVVHREGDIFGDGVNVASRVQALAGPGGICFTDQVYVQVRNKLEFPVVRLGKQPLKNIESPVEIYGIALPWQGRKPALARTPYAAGRRRKKIGIGLLAALPFLAAGLYLFVFRNARLLMVAAVDSLAVLPLQNLSGDPEQDYFADGMTEMIITELSKIKALRVISRTSVAHYKKTTKPLPEIAKELDVRNVVEGSAFLYKELARITAHLIDAKADRQLFSKDYERSLQDILALQSEVARQIAAEIKVRITPEEQKRLSSTQVVDGEAQQAYLKGRYFLNQFSMEGVRRAVEFFKEAARRDPRYAPSYAGLAEAYDVSIAMGALTPREGWPLVKAEALKALAIDETLAEAHAMLGETCFIYEWNWKEADDAYRRAVELNPGYSIGENWYGMFLLAMGRFDQALVRLKHAKELDPLSTQNVNLGLAYLYTGRYDEGIKEFKELLSLDPNFAVGRLSLGKAYLEKRMYPEATAEFQQAITLEGGSSDSPSLASVYALSGETGKARAILEGMIREAEKGDYPSDKIALVYSRLGDKDKAFEWLEKARLERAYDMILLKVEPGFKPLHSDLRFKELLKKMGL